MLWPFLGWAALAPLLAGRPPSGTGLARLADWVGVPVAAAALARLSGAARARLAWGLAGLFLLSCAAAGLQHVGVWPGPEAFESLSWTRTVFARVGEPVPGAPGRFMAGGLTFHRLRFAHVGALAVLWALAYGLSHRGRGARAALAVAGLGSVAILVFPFTRAASVMLVVAAVGVVGLALPRRLALGLGGALVLLGATAVLGYRPLRERFLTSGSAQGNGERGALLAGGLRAVATYPAAGVGPGRFKQRDFATPETPAQARQHPGKAHNQLVSMAAETGVVGAGLFLVLLGGLAWRLRPTRWEGVAGLASLGFFVLLSLVHDPLYHAQFGLALALALGAAQVRTAPAAMSAAPSLLPEKEVDALSSPPGRGTG
jgi:O-antigen ligase